MITNTNLFPTGSTIETSSIVRGGNKMLSIVYDLGNQGNVVFETSDDGNSPWFLLDTITENAITTGYNFKLSKSYRFRITATSTQNISVKLL